MTSTIYPTIGHELKFSDERKFVKKFGVGFTVNLWKRNSTTTKLITTLYKSKNQKCIQLNWYADDEQSARWFWDYEDKIYTRSYLTPLDEFQSIAIKNIYWCRNDGCWRQFQCPSEQKAHLETCRFRPKEKIFLINKGV